MNGSYAIFHCVQAILRFLIFGGMTHLSDLLTQIRGCTTCAVFLPHGVRPVVAAGMRSKLIIIGQAPGRIVHNTGIPWNDKSGENLRSWLGIDETTFYDPEQVALVPMGFCYPGTGKSGDLPPRPECATQWHQQLIGSLQEAKLVLLVGSYAQHYYLGDAAKGSLTETVRHFRDYLPQFFPLPHPSPRNNIWQKKNEWFRMEVLPALRQEVRLALHPEDQGLL
jgi:uracil-DNA glycosylase